MKTYNHKCRSQPLRSFHLHVIDSILELGRRFHELKQKYSSKGCVVF